MKSSVTHAYERSTGDTDDHWWFVGRRRIFERLLSAWVHLPPDARLLDLGPGYGTHTALLAAHGRVVSIDVDPRSLQACRGRAVTELLVADAGAPPIVDASCDLVLGLDILEHLDDDTGALREFHRVLRPGGRLLITVPAMPLLWGRQDVQSEHRRRYGKRELRERILAAGFEIERLSYFNFFLFPPILAVRLLMRPFANLAIARSDFEWRAPLGLNRILAAIFAAEAGILARCNLPIGVSLICLAHRRGE